MSRLRPQTDDVTNPVKGNGYTTSVQRLLGTLRIPYTQNGLATELLKLADAHMYRSCPQRIELSFHKPAGFNVATAINGHVCTCWLQCSPGYVLVKDLIR